MDDLPPWVVIYKHSGKAGRLGPQVTKFDPHPSSSLQLSDVEEIVQSQLGSSRVVFELPAAGGAMVTLADCCKVANGQSPRIPKPDGDELAVVAKPLAPAAPRGAGMSAQSNASASTPSGSQDMTSGIMSNVARTGLKYLWPRKREQQQVQGHNVVFWNLAAGPPAPRVSGDSDPGVQLAFLAIRRKMLGAASSSGRDQATKLLRR